VDKPKKLKENKNFAIWAATAPKGTGFFPDHRRDALDRYCFNSKKRNFALRSQKGRIRARSQTRHREKSQSKPATGPGNLLPTNLHENLCGSPP